MSIERLLVVSFFAVVFATLYMAYEAVSGTDVAIRVVKGAVDWVANSDSPAVFCFRSVISLGGARFVLSRAMWAVRPLSWIFKIHRPNDHNS